MKRSMVVLTASMFMILLTTFVPTSHTSSGATNSVRRGCVGCHVSNGCWECTGSGQAVSCPSVSCGSCTSSGVCSGGGGEEELQSLSKTSMISVETIREIAVAHPRFAATLANLNRSGLSSKVYQVNWTPIAMAPSDIEAFLSSEGDGNAFYAKFQDKIHRINKRIEKGKVDPIKYEVRVEDTESNTRLLSLRVINGSSKDPQYTSLDVRMVFGDGTLESLRKSEWTIK